MPGMPSMDGGPGAGMRGNTPGMGKQKKMKKKKGFGTL